MPILYYYSTHLLVCFDLGSSLQLRLSFTKPLPTLPRTLPLLASWIQLHYNGLIETNETTGIDYFTEIIAKIKSRLSQERKASLENGLTDGLVANKAKPSIHASKNQDSMLVIEAEKPTELSLAVGNVSVDSKGLRDLDFAGHIITAVKPSVSGVRS